MCTRWTIGMAGLLSCLFVETATAQQEQQVEVPKAGEAKSTAGKPATDKETAGEKSAKKQPTAKWVTEKAIVDAYGKPVKARQQLIDSKGKEIHFTEVPIGDTFVCYPPSRGPHPEGVQVKELPKDLLCAPSYSEPHQVVRVLSMSCPAGYKPCYVHNYPDYVACCRM